jgi:hypothetical protein
MGYLLQWYAIPDPAGGAGTRTGTLVSHLFGGADSCPVFISLRGNARTCSPIIAGLDPEVRIRSLILERLDAGYPWATVTAVLLCWVSTISRQLRRFEVERVDAVIGQGIIRVEVQEQGPGHGNHLRFRSERRPEGSSNGAGPGTLRNGSGIGANISGDPGG